MDVIEFDSISKGITWFVCLGPTAESKKLKPFLATNPLLTFTHTILQPHTYTFLGHITATNLFFIAQ